MTRALRDDGYDAADVRDTPLGLAPDQEIASFAKAEGLCIVTGDFGFADVRNYPPEDYAGLIVLGVPRNATAIFICGMIEALLARPRILSRVPGRLAIVEPGRVRLRPS